MTGTVTGMPLPAPFAEALRDAMERLADGPLAPAIDLYVTPETVVAKIALPGPKPLDLDVAIDDRLVTISGSTREENGPDYVHQELRHGSFARSFWLPTAIWAERATASFKDGLLTLTMPKTAEASAGHVKVEVT